MQTNASMQQLMRRIPAVNVMVDYWSPSKEIEALAPSRITGLVRETLDTLRQEILCKKITETEQITLENIAQRLDAIAKKQQASTLCPVINGTGIVIHTNLGRSPLSGSALEKSMQLLMGYSNLEYDLIQGKRGSRHQHLSELLCDLTGAQDAVVVNNNAAAVMLILSTFAKGKEVIVSRGELVEIGGSFRVPSVMEQSGAKLVEVGTTNKTHPQDYEQAIGEDTALLMKIHTSNFKVMGFTESVGIETLTKIAQPRAIPVVEDLGSGVLIDLTTYGIAYEPTVQDSLRQGADLVCFSGDKLLGGPQAGIIVGKRHLIERIKKNQLLRALRVDKLTLGVLYHTLFQYYDEASLREIPVLKMLSQSAAQVLEKAKRLQHFLDASKDQAEISCQSCKSQIGGGSLPTELLESYCLVIKPYKISINQLEQALRLHPLHIIGRIQNDCYLLDARTLFEADIERIARVVSQILEGEKNR